MKLGAPFTAMLAAAALAPPASAHHGIGRYDPAACHVETLTLGESPTLERYEQLTDTAPDNLAPRPANGR
jgi:hypothetical protein